MRMIRSFEDAVHEACESGEIPGFVHLCAGQEASAVGVCIQLAETDYVASTHRAHGHYIAKGGEVATLMKGKRRLAGTLRAGCPTTRIKGRGGTDRPCSYAYS